jgi:GT2 family glycosyltransferase
MTNEIFEKRARPKVLIGLPTMGNIHTLLAVTLMSWVVDSITGGQYDISLYPTLSVQPVDNARNEIVEEFLKGNATHLLFIDSDTIPTPDALQKLLAHDLDIVSAITPIIEFDDNSKMHYKKWNAVGVDDKHVSPNKGLLEVKGVGSSCIMIKKEVFEKIEKPYYRFLYEDDNGKQILVGEDIHFTIKARAKGIKTYADTSIICKHQKSIMW